MAYLYQEIQKVPGLTGSWQDKNRQLYEKLGSPKGSYRGNYDQNIWLLNQIRDNNYYKSGLPGTQTPKPATSTSNTLAESYAQPGVDAGKAADQPSFQEAMPFYEAWQGFVPQASQAAASQVNPEAQRQLKSSMYDYNMGMAGSGGQRFGRALGGRGDLRAAAERNRQAQMQDWLNQYQQGYKQLFYEPSETAWNRAVTQGTTPDKTLTEIPSWEDVYSRYQDVYGVGENTSPFYG
jgi:hypothetical protein